MSKYELEDKLLTAIGLGMNHIRKLVLTLEFNELPKAAVTIESWPPVDDELKLTTTHWEFGTYWFEVTA